ncbi:MAG TPA: D-alanyl-D-alanine carboxypeptidase/D-alanyl-D-alanine-endopeptidase, partial [Steroidobacteraceae bacterium]|nr:D-alanyl-D-alanine carboxypeptidase/D-alanyl-D-alanine-endopeptidase [Steroidobacteraceae bacterium]
MPRRLARIPAALATLLLAAVPAAARDHPYLPAEVERALAQYHLPGTSLSVLVREVGRDEPLVSYNSSVPRNPASTMKILTTYAALEILGPAYVWRTRAYATGPVRDQVLEGDLVLVGGGDPFMTAERWWAFVSSLRQLGVQRIAGDVVIDHSLFAPQGDDRGSFDNQPYRSYNVLPDALMVNFQTVTLSLVPDPQARTVRASLNPWPANLALENSVHLEAGSCRHGAEGVAVDAPDGPTGGRLAVSGHYAEGCDPLQLQRAVMRAPEFAYGLFRTFWQQSGGVLDGALRLGTVPADARLLYTQESLTLGEVIRLVNKYSSNLGARTLLLTLGAEKAGRPATMAGGRQAILEFLAARGLATPELAIENGSGLSREERISAVGLAGVLLAAYRSQYMPEFAASLPLAALDGTMRRRFLSPQ